MLVAIALVASALYLGALFWIAARADRAERPVSARHRGWIYGLSLAVYCTSWTFFGGVGTAATAGLQYLPIYLGPILLFTLGYGLIGKILRQAKAQHSTSIADFLSARYGKSAAIAALVTIIATVGSLPYMALQLQSVGATLVALDGSLSRNLAMDETVLAVATTMALFAIFFGSRRADQAGENSGLVLTIAVEAVVKLFALIVLAVAALVMLADTEAPRVASVFNESQLDLRFLILTLLAACAALCLPRQFHMAFVEAPDDRPDAAKQWIFPAYLVLTSLVIVPIVLAGLAILPPDTPRDSIVMALPLAMGNDALALLMFIGGLSASTGMIMVASVALSTMITNDLLAPVIFRRALSGQGDRTRLASRLLLVRRVVIAALLLFSYLVYRQFGESESLAGLGTLAFAAAAQFAPGLVLGVLTRHGNRIGMLSGLATGFGLWLVLLAIPAATGVPPPMQMHEDTLVSGVILSLGANVLIYWLASGLFVPSLLDAAQAAAFVGRASSAEVMAYATRKRIADIRLLLAQVVGPERARAALAAMPGHYRDSDQADEAVMAMAERTIAGVVGSSSSRLLVGSWSGGEPVPLADVVAMFDETSRRLTFSADLLQLAIENIDQGVAVVDADMNLVAWNSRYTAMFGLPEALVTVGTPIAQLIRWNLMRSDVPRDEVERQVERRLEHMRAGTQHRMEREQPDGTIMRIIGNPAPGGGYVTSYLDVTADRRAEQALEEKVAERTKQLSEANAALERATRSKTRFLAAASHDLIQPLNAARLFASALDEEFEASHPARKLVRDLDGSISSADRLIRALLDISKLDGGGIEAKLERVALNDLLEETVRQFEVQARAKGLRLRHVPTRAVIQTDRALMGSVLRNLVSNAVRYTATGGVLIGVRRSGQGIRLGVYDTGRGIAEDDVQRIFDEFQRGKSTDSEGLGLGLAIVRRITALLDVHVETRSVEGQGSCFSLHLEPVEWGAGQTAKRPSQRSTELGAARVLVVDNDAAAREGARALLERWQLEVIDAADEMSARLATPQPPDIVIMDYQLDDGARGHLVYEALCDHWGERPPVILHTAEAGSETEEAARAIGAHRLLKPAAPASLRSLLASLIAQRASGDAAAAGQADGVLAAG
ncbi:hybrid sensor histidine kinase/response regulator [Erythrobacter sp. EC-HK427]|uniref:hybrid sensor histidine kinase/response regulator n=1 Tax=Erythrobacter sp. EC-HK427 TaxID=2038396 RepID=UPI00125BC0B1|nr:PAS-domain containing protein [Erythrobacter sp. EC-HK427]VVT20813.1 Na+/proline symporter [Erythrobacter sp. EC-HK427]